MGKSVHQASQGLELQNLRLRNKVLLAKWLWPFALELESLRQRIIVSKHDPIHMIGFGW